MKLPGKAARQRANHGRVVKAKQVKIKAKPGQLPCSATALMIPTDKAKDCSCPGVNNRMRKCKNKTVGEVLWKMEYSHPNKAPGRLLRYSLPDLRYDLKWGYVKVKSSAKTAKSSGKAAKAAPRPAKKDEEAKVKGTLPCAATWLMLPTDKVPLYEGIRNRMKKCRNKRVKDVLHKMTYHHPAKCPDGLITYNLMDLKYDLKCAYLKVKAPRAAAVTSTKRSAQVKRSRSTPSGIIVPTGKVAQCSGINARMRAVKGLRVEEAIGKVKYQSPKGRLTYGTKDLTYDLGYGYLRLQARGGSAVAKSKAKSRARPKTEAAGQGQRRTSRARPKTEAKKTKKMSEEERHAAAKYMGWRVLPSGNIFVRSPATSGTNGKTFGTFPSVDAAIQAIKRANLQDSLLRERVKHVKRPAAKERGRPKTQAAEKIAKAPELRPEACNEMPMQSLTSDGMAFYPAADDQLAEVAATCRLRYGLTPRTTWLQVNFGGSNLQVGNLLFTNGEKDPWRTGAPKFESLMEGLDISEHLITGGAHHEDLRFDASPPKEPVTVAKAVTRMAMKRWIASFTRKTLRFAGRCDETTVLKVIQAQVTQQDEVHTPKRLVRGHDSPADWPYS